MNTLRLQRNLNVKYSLVQGLYWMLYCILIGYASVFLLDKGYTNSQIGVILAIGFLGSIILQQFIAMLADKSTKISLTTIIILCLLCLGTCCAGLILIKSKSSALSILFVLAAIILMLIQPFVNSLNFYLENLNVKMNFGVARSMGSLFFAVTSLILGNAIENKSPNILPVCGLTVSACIIFVLLLIAYDYKINSHNIENKTESTEYENGNIREFFHHYRMFFLFLFGSLGLFFGHTLINNYLFQITVNAGGSSKDLGGIQSMAAMLELPAMIFFEPLRKRFGCVKLLKFSAVFFFIKAGITMFAGSVPMLYVSMLCQMPAFAIYTPGSVHFVNETMLPKDAVKGQAFVTGMITLANLLSSLLGGMLLDNFSVFLMLGVGSVASLLGAVIAVYALSRTISAT